MTSSLNAIAISLHSRKTHITSILRMKEFASPKKTAVLTFSNVRTFINAGGMIGRECRKTNGARWRCTYWLVWLFRLYLHCNNQRWEFCCGQYRWTKMGKSVVIYLLKLPVFAIIEGRDFLQLCRLIDGFKWLQIDGSFTFREKLHSYSSQM